MLKKGIDYYIENGLYVFTEHYLKERGYCCGSGCRHCPYKKKKEEPLPEGQRPEEQQAIP